MTINHAVERWLGELARQGKRPRTLDRYARLLYKLGDMYPNSDVDEVTTDMVRRYLDRHITYGHDGNPLDVDTVSQRTGIVKRFFLWLRMEGIIPTDPAERVKAPQRKNPLENDTIVTISSAEAQRMLAVARRDIATETAPWDQYRKALCLGVLGYTGSRRHAVSQLKIADYDGLAEPPTLTFHEKGGKTIRKPISAKLADLIREAWLAGVWQDDPKNPNGYLIPPRGGLRRKGERDDRIIWKLVKDVADDAHVVAHVHALRAAFAVFFIERHPGERDALQDLMGHSDPGTTKLYLRRLDRQKGMRVVVNLDWDTPLDEQGGSPDEVAAPPVSQQTERPEA